MHLLLQKKCHNCTSNEIAKVAYQPYLACIPPGYTLVEGAECHYHVITGKQLAANQADQKNSNGEHY